VSDKFMGAIEVITSSTVEAKVSNNQLDNSSL
jgi:hypothetical protein